MNVDDVMFFITATRSVLQADLQVDIIMGRPAAGSGGEDFIGDVSGIIEFEGAITGSMVLVSPASTAREIVRRVRTERSEFDESDISEVLGPLLARIRSEVATGLEGRDVHVGRPSVVIGHGHRFRPAGDCSCVSIPIGGGLGRLRLEVALEPVPVEAC
ncbi:MAG: hypothetical protein CMJ23_03910 [Phycisphaerae bacterium]|nr:hypothetical protein [Phycisphaerae bacterium]